MTYQPPQDPHPHYAYGQQPIPPQPTEQMNLAALTGSAGRRPVRLGAGQKASLVVGGGVLALLLCCGGLGAIVTIGDDKPDPPSGAPAFEAGTPPSATPTVEVTESPSAPAPPTIEKRTVTETRKIPFAAKTVKDSSLAKGTSKVRTKGVAGVKTLTYEVTLTNGVQTGKKLLREKVTRAPVTKVTAIGTKETRQCDPNYGGCVPVASDVDCLPGSGNGPAYISGAVKVIGSDIYDLDRDNDGYGCERD